jgi:predicted 3-demethylubiquinone-9 3-methyltransferase (glyoxalase superfamily)
MPPITTHLWFDKEAKAAAEFYASTFEGSKIKSASTLDNTPSGTVELVSVDLAGQPFRLLSAGPLFKFTPAVSFLVACSVRQEVDTLWKKLSQGGKVHMELGKYPFSERYGWTEDRFGLSWQIMFMGLREITQKITPTLMFTGSQSGRAEEAINLYTTVFHHSRAGDILRYGKGEAPDREGTIKHAAFTLEGETFAAMDSARPHDFTFNEAISFIVNCDTQAEIDYYWGKLSADPKAEQCGWLKDKFGLSWQVVPNILGELLGDKDNAKRARVTEAFLKMKKFDIARLKEASEEQSKSVA